MNDGAGRRLNAELHEDALYEILEFPIERGNKAGGVPGGHPVSATARGPL